MDKYKIEVERISYGQPRPYADSKYHFIIKVENMNKYTVEDFCRKWLYPHKILTNKETEEMSKESIYFYGTSSFIDKGNNVYEYIVNKPFCD